MTITDRDRFLILSPLMKVLFLPEWGLRPWWPHNDSGMENMERRLNQLVWERLLVRHRTVAQVAGDDVRDRTLLARRARDRGQLREQVDDAPPDFGRIGQRGPAEEGDLGMVRRSICDAHHGGGDPVRGRAGDEPDDHLARLDVEAGERIVVGDTQVLDGRVLPFSEVRCDEVRRALSYLAPAATVEQRQKALGLAMGRVVAHELYHVLAHTTEHTQRGLARATQTLRDLVSSKAIRFREEEAEAMRAYITNA